MALAKKMGAKEEMADICCSQAACESQIECCFGKCLMRTLWWLGCCATEAWKPFSSAEEASRCFLAMFLQTICTVLLLQFHGVGGERIWMGNLPRPPTDAERPEVGPPHVYGCNLQSLDSSTSQGNVPPSQRGSKRKRALSLADANHQATNEVQYFCHDCQSNS